MIDTKINIFDASKTNTPVIYKTQPYIYKYNKNNDNPKTDFKIFEGQHSVSKTFTKNDEQKEISSRIVINIKQERLKEIYLHINRKMDVK